MAADGVLGSPGHSAGDFEFVLQKRSGEAQYISF